MTLWSLHLLALLAVHADPLGPGDHTRTLKMGEQTRSYIVHVPKSYDPKKPAPVVLALHGAGMNGAMMVPFCGLNSKSDEAGFLAVYPSGTGAGNLFLTWNAGGLMGQMSRNKVDDVAFIGKLLDDLATAANVDPKRIYAAGMSNGAMMAYRLAAEMSDRIAAIAPVAGTMTIDEVKLKRPVPVIHFHGTADNLVPFGGPGRRNPSPVRFRSVEETVKLWAKQNGCPDEPAVKELPNEAKDKLKVTRKTWGPGTDGAEVVLYVVEGGGHTWPGRDLPFEIVGKSTKNISASDLLWEFFQKHPMK
jgi:polyhydroxybutyrate depolymerase